MTAIEKLFLYMFNNNYSQITPKRLMRRELLSFIDITTEIWHSCIINKQKIRRINVQSVPYDALNKLWGTFFFSVNALLKENIIIELHRWEVVWATFSIHLKIIFASWIINVGRHTATFKVKISDLFFTSQNASLSSYFSKSSGFYESIIWFVSSI